jgi:hypothetical protein
MGNTEFLLERSRPLRRLSGRAEPWEVDPSAERKEFSMGYRSFRDELDRDSIKTE